MKKIIFIITALVLMAIALPGCAAGGVSQEEYDEFKQQLDVIEAKFDLLETELSEIRGELEAVHTQVAEEPLTEGKLVGVGPIGYDDPGYDGTHISSTAIFLFTNPDNVGEITIEQIRIIGLDGTVEYEGPVLYRQIDEEHNVNWVEGARSMKPHQLSGIILDWYLCDQEDYWESIKEVRLRHLWWYTVEICWTGSERGLPLMGWAFQQLQKIDEEGNLVFGEEGLPEVMPTWTLASGTPMVNMEQELEPED